MCPDELKERLAVVRFASREVAKGRPLDEVLQFIRGHTKGMIAPVWIVMKTYDLDLADAYRIVLTSRHFSRDHFHLYRDERLALLRRLDLC